MVNDWEIIDSFLRKVRNEPAKEWYAWYNFERRGKRNVQIHEQRSVFPRINGESVFHE